LSYKELAISYKLSEWVIGASFYVIPYNTKNYVSYFVDHLQNFFGGRSEEKGEVPSLDRKFTILVGSIPDSLL
jgi:hypothetical protein